MEELEEIGGGAYDNGTFNTRNSEEIWRKHLFCHKPEMEFLDINLTKDSSLLLSAIYSPFYWRILRKTILFSGLKNPYKQIRETRKLESFLIKSILEKN